MARRLVRRTPGRRDSQTFRPWLPDRYLWDKVRCHKVLVTNVTEAEAVVSGQWSVVSKTGIRHFWGVPNI
jgi:hypothetical protein